MPWLLYRYILGEVLRVMLLTAGVLVTVIAFGATIKPLATGLLDPADVAKYVAMAIVPMLQFALPFSGGFAATMVFHRLVGDNEILAISVSGVSYRRILAPIFAIGAAFTILMLVLVHQIIPHFWVLMQKTVQQDITRILEQAVENNEAFTLGGNTQVYAEDIRVDLKPEGTNAVKRLWLSKVAAADLDIEGRIAADVTARIAAVDFFVREDDRQFIQLHMQDCFVFKPVEQQVVFMPRVDTKPIPVLDTLRDNVKFMPLHRILYVWMHPDAFSKVIEKKQFLADAILRRDLWLEIVHRVESAGMVTFLGVETGDRTVIYGQRARGMTLTRRGPEALRVEEWRGDTLRRLLECESVELAESSSDESGVAYTLTLTDVRVLDIESNDELSRQSTSHILNMTLENFSGQTLTSLPAEELLDRARKLENATHDRSVVIGIDKLEDKLLELDSEVKARISQRCALSATALLLFLLGSLLAIKLREVLPLIIYLIAFIPSIIDILMISGGEQMMRDDSILAGFIVMWSGNLLLLLICVVTYGRIAKH